MKLKLDLELVAKELYLRTVLGVCPQNFSESGEWPASLAVKVKALSKESLFLLWVEEMSQTSRGARMGWVCCSSSLTRYKGPGEQLPFCLISPQTAHPSRLSSDTQTHTHTHTRARAHTPGFLRNPVEKWQDPSCHPASLPFSALPPTPVMGVRKDSPFEKAAASGSWRKAFPSGGACLVHIHFLLWFRSCLWMLSPECVVQKVNSHLANDSVIFNVFNQCVGTAGISHPRHQKTSPICGLCVYHKKMLFRRMGCNLWLGGSIPRMGEVHQHPDHLAKLLRSWNQDGTFVEFCGKRHLKFILNYPYFNQAKNTQT